MTEQNELQLSGDSMPEEELIKFARMCEGLVDIFQLRLQDMDFTHFTAYNFDGGVPPTLAFADEALRFCPAARRFSAAFSRLKGI